jgi:hypothetical protein
MDMYKLSDRTFGYDTTIQDRTTKMLGKLHVKIVSNLQISMLSFLSICYLMEILFVLFPFHLFLVDVWWPNYGRRVLDLQKLAIQVLRKTCSSSRCERNWSA